MTIGGAVPTRAGPEASSKSAAARPALHVDARSPRAFSFRRPSKEGSRPCGTTLFIEANRAAG
jgi:hypothetical protein